MKASAGKLFLEGLEPFSKLAPHEGTCVPAKCFSCTKPDAAGSGYHPSNYNLLILAAYSHYLFSLLLFYILFPPIFSYSLHHPFSSALTSANLFIHKCSLSF